MPFNCLNTLDVPIQYQTYTTPKLTPYQHSKHDNKSINLILSLRYYNTMPVCQFIHGHRDVHGISYAYLIQTSE